jgi:hypothetical protein
VLNFEGKRQLAFHTATEPGFMKITTCSINVDVTLYNKENFPHNKFEGKFNEKSPFRGVK